MNKKRYIIPVFVPHLGCPYSCVFCNQVKITNHKQAMVYDEVIDTIETHLSYFPKNEIEKEIAFFGGSFTAIRYDLMVGYLEIAKKYKDEGKIDQIRLSTRPDCIDERILDTLKEYGVDIIELGVQSMVDDILLANNRGHDSKSVVEASKLIKSYGFILGHQIMPGLYRDTKEAMIYTAKKSIELKPDIVRIYPTLIVKNTKLEYLYEIGEYKPLSMDEAIDICGELLLMYKEADITVIRIGLQATENINVGADVVAGPFHPSFRQLVEQNLYLKAIDKAIEENEFRADEISFKVPKEVMSYVVGNKGYNRNYLEDKYGYKKISFCSKDSGENIDISQNGREIQIGVI